MSQAAPILSTALDVPIADILETFPEGDGVTPIPVGTADEDGTVESVRVRHHVARV